MFNMLIYHISGVKNPADAPSRREDFAGGDKSRNNSFFFTAKLAVVAKTETNEGRGDLLYFQSPSAEMILYLKHFYTDDNRKLKGLTF
jgi:hypothetical protein